MNKNISIKILCFAFALLFLLSACKSKKAEQTLNNIDVSSTQSVGLPSQSSSSDYVIESSSEQSSTHTQTSSKPAVTSKVPSSSALVQSVVPSSSKPSSSSVQQSPSSKPSSSSEAASSTPPSVIATTDELRAVWITYIELDGILRGKTEKEFKAKIEQYFDNCVKNGFNSVIVQVRSHADAIYPSEYYPTAVHFTKVRSNSAPFDALQVMIDAAHARKLKIHAWVNPFRGHRQKHTLAEKDPMKTYKNMTYLYDGIYYLDPAYPQVRELIVNGIKEIVTKYDVDGIHFDDRFYPTRDEQIDNYSFTLLGNGKTRKQFRLDNVNTLIKDIYSTIKSIKNIPFGISPEGNIDNNYDINFADVKRWASEKGYVDYIAPQLYWSYTEGKLPYEEILPVWQDMVTCSDVKLLVGLAPYKVGTKPVWNAGDILKREIVDARKFAQYGGFIMYRYENYFSSACDTERKNVNALLGVK